MTFGKELFTVKMYAVCSLPSVTLDKAFAKCIWIFVECPWHSANLLYPVVRGPSCKESAVDVYWCEFYGRLKKRCAISVSAEISVRRRIRHSAANSLCGNHGLEWNSEDDERRRQLIHQESGRVSLVSSSPCEF